MEPDSDSPKTHALFEACKTIDLEAVQKLLQDDPNLVAMNYSDHYRAPPLITALLSGVEPGKDPKRKNELVKLLISHGAHVNWEVTNSIVDLGSPLYIVLKYCRTVDLDILESLLEAGKCDMLYLLTIVMCFLLRSLPKKKSSHADWQRMLAKCTLPASPLTKTHTDRPI